MRATTRQILLMASASMLAVLGASSVHAAQHEYQIPAQDMATALRLFARISGARVVAASDLVAGRQSGAASGALSSGQALDALLAGSGLHAALVAGAYVIRPDDGRNEGTKGRAAMPGDVVVTGTRIHGSGPIGAPLTIIDRKAIEDSGRATVADYVQTLPQNFGGSPSEGSYGNNVQHGTGANRSYGASIDLRGLGTQSTLVLFDGNRPALSGADGAFVDTSLIPSTAIDRIEILTDGASAIYGTDAVAGVVNIRFRNRLNGFETRLYAGTAGGDYNQRQFGQAAGKRWSTGGIMVAYQYDHHSTLSGADRVAGSEDLRPFGGPDNRTDYTLPGNIIAADGEVFAIPTGQNGHSLTADQLIRGQENRVDRRFALDLLPSQTTHSIYAAADQEIGGGISAYAHLLYAYRRFSIVNPSDTQFEVEVPTSNPFYVDPIGTGEPVAVHYDFSREVGPPLNPGSVNAVTSSAGLKKQVGGWAIELAGSYGRQVERNKELNVISPTRVDEVIADTNPTTALDVFGDGTGNDPATIDFIRAERQTYGRYAVWSASLRADGALFSLPAGMVRVATGVEHRDERFYGYTDSTRDSVTPIRTVLAGTPGHRHVDAVYGELSIPVLGPETDGLPGRLDLSLAGRIDWYSDVGRTTNPKAGLRWEPTGGLILRGSYGTSFRAPSFTEAIGSADNIWFPLYLQDPLSPTGRTAVITLNGHSANLKPERATSWTAGLDFKPHAVPGLTFSATWFDIEYRDRIGSATYDYTNFLLEPGIYGSLTTRQPDAATVAVFYASDRFFNPLAIRASAIGAIVNLETLNLSRTRVQGIDFDLAYARPLFGGTWSSGIDGTRLLVLDQGLTPTAPNQHVLGTIFNPVKLRLRGHTGWSKGGFDLSATLNYTDGYTNGIVSPTEHVANWTTVDGQIGYRFSKASPLAGARLALSAINLFNRRPPYVQNVFADRTLAYDPGQANAVGRLISVSASLSW